LAGALGASRAAGTECGRLPPALAAGDACGETGLSLQGRSPGCGGAVDSGMAWIYLWFVLVWGGLTAIAWWPPKGRGSILGFGVGWLYGELPLHHIAVQVGVTLCFLGFGYLDSSLGRFGLLLAMGNWAWLLALAYSAFQLPERAERAMTEAFGPQFEERVDPELEALARTQLDWKRIPSLCAAQPVGVNLHFRSTQLPLPYPAS